MFFIDFQAKSQDYFNLMADKAEIWVQGNFNNFRITQALKSC